MSSECDCYNIVASLKPNKPAYCPICGDYIINIFIGEKFLPNDDETPLHKLIQDAIYNRPKVKGKLRAPFDFSQSSLWKNIKKAIDKSEVCLFDVTEKRFNVGYELGYAMGTERVIYCCSSCSKSKHKDLPKFTYYDCPPKEDCYGYGKLIDIKKELKKNKILEYETYNIMEIYEDKKKVERIKKIFKSFEGLFHTLDWLDIKNELNSLTIKDRKVKETVGLPYFPINMNIYFLFISLSTVSWILEISCLIVSSSPSVYCFN